LRTRIARPKVTWIAGSWRVSRIAGSRTAPIVPGWPALRLPSRPVLVGGHGGLILRGWRRGSRSGALAASPGCGDAENRGQRRRRRARRDSRFSSVFRIVFPGHTYLPVPAPILSR
jgi:hypothetical protein